MSANKVRIRLSTVPQTGRRVDQHSGRGPREKSKRGTTHNGTPPSGRLQFVSHWLHPSQWAWATTPVCDVDWSVFPLMVFCRQTSTEKQGECLGVVRKSKISLDLPPRYFTVQHGVRSLSAHLIQSLVSYTTVYTNAL